jgi:hemin uptake protein HemP
VSLLQKNTETTQRLGPAASAGSSTRNLRSEINSRALLVGTDCIAIRHGECVYWLRATRQGKLLLTK